MTLAGYLGEHAPTDDAGYRDYARSLLAPDVPDIYDLITTAEPLTDAVTMRFPASRRRRYERLASLPRGLGGHWRRAVQLQPRLRPGHDRRGARGPGPRSIHRRRCRRSGQAVLPAGRARWWTRRGTSPSTGDLRLPDIEGERTAQVRFVNWYLDRLHIAAHHDAVVAAAFQQVVNMLAPPPSVLRPRIALRVAGATDAPTQRRDVAVARTVVVRRLGFTPTGEVDSEGEPILGLDQHSAGDGAR